MNGNVRLSQIFKTHFFQLKISFLPITNKLNYEDEVNIKTNKIHLLSMKQSIEKTPDLPIG